MLKQNPDVEMASEDLFISAQEIRVRYIFFNRSDREIRTLVAFPMPDVRGSEEPQSMPTDEPENLLDFVTIANGVPVRALVEQKAFVGQYEHTARLKALGIPLAPHLQSTQRALTRLPRSEWAALNKLEIAEVVKFDAGRGWQEELAPRWTMKSTWYWEQAFAARAETRIEHRYKPATGASAGTSLGSPHARNEDWYRDYQRKYCMDAGFLSAIARARARARAEFGAPFTEERISYILTTGANWAGPIREFRLVVDKGAPDNIVSFCGKGVKKISPTQFEVRYKDFTPRADFHVLILKPIKIEP